MRARPFFITGLPRSRTAWLSAYLSMGDTLCYHEPLKQITELDDLRGLLDSPYYDFIGAADSGLGFHLDWVTEHLACPVLIVERPRAQVEASIQRMGLPATNYCELLEKELRRFSGHTAVMRVPFEKLSDRRVMEKVFWHLMPGRDFDEVRFRQFCAYNIQVDPKEVHRTLQERKLYIDHIMQDWHPRIRVREVQNEVQAPTG